MNHLSRKISVLAIAWMAFLFSFVDRLAWPPIIPIASEDIGITATKAGSLMTAFYIGYVITQLPGGLLTDRFGYRKVLLGSFLMMSIFTALMSTVQSYEQGFFMRILAGLGSGAVFAACIRAIFDWFPSKGRATAIGFFMTSSSLGVSVVNLFVPIVSENYGWRIAFLIAGALPFIGLLLGIFLLKEKTPIKTQQQRQSSASFWKDVFTLLKNRNLLLTGLSGFCAMWATWGTSTWANSYLHDSLDISLVKAGVVMSVFGATALFSKPIIGLLSDLMGGKRKPLLFVSLACFGPMLLRFGSNTNTSMVYVLAGMLGITAYVYSPLMNTFVGEVVPPQLVATASGLVNTIWQLGSLLSPLAVGAVIEATDNYFYAFVTLAIGPILAALIILLVKEQKNNTAEVN